MRINEIFGSSPIGIYDPQADEVNRAKINDTRKSRLTLRDLNRLKKLRAFKNLQALKQRDEIAVIYGGGGGEDLF